VAAIQASPAQLNRARVRSTVSGASLNRLDFTATANLYGAPKLPAK
jgi:hypothetical protein